MTLLRGLIIAALVLPVLLLIAGQAGLLSGRLPSELGVRDGRLNPPSSAPNSVSSQTALWPGTGHTSAAIDPLPAPAGKAATMARLQALAEAMPGARIADVRDGYLYVQFTTRWLKFVDDAEFWFDPVAQVVQVRSASRLGKSDFGVNRARIEDLRTRLAAP